MIICQSTRGALSSGDGLALSLPFAESKLLTPLVGPTPTFTRASRASFIGEDGLMKTAELNVPRFDHDPATYICRGLLIEATKTNFLFPSDTLITQTLTIANVTHTLSFYGTGTIVLSGAISATVVGSGAYPNRTIFTFTPNAGSLTLTVTGTVQFAQLEGDNYVTSWIPTTTAAATRSADVCSIGGANFSEMWNATEGVLYASFYTYRSTKVGGLISAGRAGTGAGRIHIGTVGTTRATFEIADDSNVIQFNYLNASVLPYIKSKAAFAYQQNNCTAVVNNTGSGVDTSVTLGTQNQLLIGGLHSSNRPLNGAIDSIRVYRRRLPFVKLQNLVRP
jgi:hypothetical protein